ncbi:hypothetical protein D3C86_972290 [compost metagenome]
MGRVIREFLAQVPDHDTQVVSVFGVGRSPDVLEQLLLGDHPPRMPRQLRQHGVFLASQRDFDTVEQYPAIRQVDRQRTEAQRRWLGFADGRLAQQRTNPRQEFLDAERLGHVVIGAAIQGLDFLPFTGAHGEHQHRHRRPLAKIAQYLLAVHVRQAEVEHQQVRLVQRGLRQSFTAGTRLQHFVALGSEADAQEFADLRFVVNDQNGRGLAHEFTSTQRSGKRVAQARSGFTFVSRLSL